MKRTAIILGLFALIMVEGVIYTNEAGQQSQETTVKTHTGGARVSVKEIKSTNAFAALFSANGKVISWETSGFASGESVDINLIQKVSDDPTTYTLVREIAKNIKNDGSYTWNPQAGEIEANMFIEVTCSENSTEGCEVGGSPLSVK